jgi:hypothetical protein
MARAVGDQVNILAIDPGPTESAYVFFDGEKVWSCGKYQNHTVLGIVKQSAEDAEGANRLVIEMIAHYGSGILRVSLCLIPAYGSDDSLKSRVSGLQSSKSCGPP